MEHRYKYIFNGRWDILLEGEYLYDIIDMVDGILVASYNSAVDVKYKLKELNNQNE